LLVLWAARTVLTREVRQQKLEGVLDHSRAIDQGPYRTVDHARCGWIHHSKKPEECSLRRNHSHPEKISGRADHDEGVLWRLIITRPDYVPLESENETVLFEAWIVDDNVNPIAFLYEVPADLKPGDSSAPLQSHRLFPHD